MSASTPIKPIPASTVLLLRQRAQLEVFMVVRHDGHDFGPGALVFPGGKVDAGDSDPVLREWCGDVTGVSDAELAFRVAAIREAFEEANVLLARDQTGDLVGCARLDELNHYRAALVKHELPIAEFLRRERLTLACDLLAPFGHWVTPVTTPKRFDTHFFIAIAPEDHLGAHDGEESVESIWINPGEAVRDSGDDEKWFLMPPTEVNLRLLARSDTVDAAMELARTEKVISIFDGTDPRYPQIDRRNAYLGRAKKPT